MRRNFTRFLKLALLCCITVLITIFLYKSFHMVLSLYNDDNSIDYSGHKAQRQQQESSLNSVMERLRAAASGVLNKAPSLAAPDSGSFFAGHPRNIGQKKIDWEDYTYLETEQNRKGIGEQGKPGKVPAEREAERQDIFDHNGFNGLLSDMISLNRSVPDIRYKHCKGIRYLAELPTVSVIVPFFNEHWSTLLRTCYSVLNRSPPDLIKEIILVDDFSDKTFLKAKLDAYVEEHLPKVKIIRLPERSGLILARITGAKAATSDVLIFLDSHVEPSYNWLPPLLDPIATNYKVCMCPFIDVIAYDTFEYRAQDEGARGAFDWQFYYKRLPLLPDDLEHPTRPFKSPVMAGGLFAISTKFFWELGGYDEGLDIWGGEQYELSFKIWQCGGEMYDAPCSRIGHVYRGAQKYSKNPRTTDYVHKNYKRVAEAWMDEYKEYLYNRSPMTYAAIDAGDISKSLAIRKKLNCKSFKWFMEEVAFDLPLKYPPVEPPDFAFGTIRSLAHPELCADSMGNSIGGEIGLYSCAINHKEPQKNQFFTLSWHKDIRIRDTTHCWDVPTSGKNAPIIFYDCHGQQGNQGWRYHLDTKWLTVGSNNRCLDLNHKNKKLYVNPCDKSNQNMQWEWGYANATALSLYDRIGAKSY